MKLAEIMLFVIFTGLAIFTIVVLIDVHNEMRDIREDCIQHERDFGLGLPVSTTVDYEILTNDSFSGVVVLGEGCGDPALTVRNMGGEERRIATQFLEPMR